MIVVPILFIGIVNLAIGCNRSGRNLLVEDRSAREIIQSFKNDFDMNVAFGLRKMGINRRSGKEKKHYSKRRLLGFLDTKLRVT